MSQVDQGAPLSPGPPPIHRRGAPQAEPADTPGVWPWFIAYCVVLALLSLGLCGFGSVYLVLDPRELEMDPLEARIVGVFFMALGATLSIPYFAAPLLPKRKWVWIYDLVLICFGMTNCCSAAMGVPLLIFWIQPATRKYFGWT